MRNPMAIALAALTKLAGSKVLDRWDLRDRTHEVVFRATRSGFRTAGAVSRAFTAAQRRAAPARLPASTTPALFDLTPTEDQALVRDTMAEFAREQLRPAADEADREAAAPKELLTTSAGLGLTMIGVPEELGGAGTERSQLTSVLVAEQLGHGDMGLAVACLAPAAVSTALTLWGDEQQQATYLPAFVGDDPPAAALAILEPRPLFDPFSLDTRARRSGEVYLIDGVKSLVPRAADAELFVVAAELDGVPRLFLLESDDVTVEAEPAMGLRAASMGRLVLDGVAARPLGTGRDYAECVQLSRLAWCGLAVGTAQAVLDYVIPYVNERHAFGEPVSHRQAVAFMVADIGIETDGMRLVTYRAAGRAAQGLPFAREVALARQLCAERGVRIGSDGVQLLGGHGFVKDHPVQRWYRDLRAVGVMEGGLLA